MKKILVIGDSCEDVFVYGECKRLNPEAPTPVFSPIKEKKYGGMAANVVNNLRSLGMDVDFITNREEIIKKRFVDVKSNYILIRVDEEPKLETYIVDVNLIKRYDAVVVSDYNKGFVGKDEIELILNNSKLSFIDTKKSFGRWISGAKFIKINEHEYNNPSHKMFEGIEDKLIVTYGGNGCYFRKKSYPTQKVDIIDVVGAGDSFFAGLVFSYLETQNIDEAINFANKCGAYAVSQRGISTLENLK